MKTKLFLFWIIFKTTIVVGQADSIFIVSQERITDSLRTQIESLKKNNQTFYEDDQYIVSKTCSGEWGGTIKFKNKKTGIEYSCSATCPISVNKINDKYFVTNSLGHLRGSCEVLEISKPELMEVYKITPPRNVNGKKIKYHGDDESKSTKGTKKLIRDYGKLILGSFLFNGQFYHIVMDEKETYMATIENEKFKIIKHITNEDVFTYDNDILKTKDGHIIIPISGGYLDIFENQVKILRHQ